MFAAIVIRQLGEQKELQWGAGLRGGRLVAVLIPICVVSASLGAAGVAWRENKARMEQASRLLRMQMTVRCHAFWNYRSALADAESEFRSGRRELLQEVKSYDPALEFWIPGLRESAVAEIRRNYPLDGPDFEDIADEIAADGALLNGLMGPECSRTHYAWEYNVTMLRLLGREGDIRLPPVSPELSPRTSR